MKRLTLVLTVAVFLLLVAGVGTAAAEPPAQLAGQEAGSGQDAVGAAGTGQYEPSNDNGSVRVLSPGEDGSVSQSNEASSNASAGNVNVTDQDATQNSSGGSVQAIGQSATNAQDALAFAFTVQKGAENENASTRVLSENDGSPMPQSNDAAPADGGSVTQSNDASSDAEAGNINATEQSADQSQGGPTADHSTGGDPCCGGGEQVIGQSAENEQSAEALAATVQEKPSNTNVSVRVLSPGDNGSVRQSNEASSDASAGNLNVTEQTATQDQAGGSGSQTIGQAADSEQSAKAAAATIQEKPSNTNVSVRVLSPGDNGPVTQSNKASSDASAGNLNATKQKADQEQSGDGCRCKSSGEQFIGQSAKNDQDAKAAALTVQHGASNENIDVRVLSPGASGPVEQSNVASSNAEAGNLNVTKQDADQVQSGHSCKCDAGSQHIGQAAINHQGATALAGTIQVEPSNTNAGVRVLSEGDDGPVRQVNKAESDATAVNLNATEQKADQTQGGSGLQVIGQAALSSQGAFALGATLQVGASNENAPTRVLSKGDGGPVTQANIASSDATAGNLNHTGQKADQQQSASGCCGGHGIQALGQLAINEQGAFALAGTLQLNAKQPCKCGDSSGGNSNAPTRVKSSGDDGPVRQANIATSEAEAGNWNATKQDAHQLQAARCLCKADGIQALGQLSKNEQLGGALAVTLQLGARKAAPEPKHGRVVMAE